jgi:hypothetical protein
MPSAPVLVRLVKPMRGAPEDALLPAEIAWAMLATGEATNPRDRFGASVEPPASTGQGVLSTEPPARPAEKARYANRAMKGRA